MSYNGIGLQTTRGTGTNGYVVRNLSHLRPRDGPPGGRPGEYGSSFGGPDDGPPIHRQPDQGILDHERKRKVEVKCLELRDELEDKGVDEDTIEEQVALLRTRLNAQAATTSHSDIRQLKSSDTHGRAAAKQAEMNKMGRALGINAGYVEGGAFSRKDAEMERIEKAQRREENERRQAEALLKREQERERREADFKEQERLRRRQEHYARLEAEKAQTERQQRPRSPPLDYNATSRTGRRSPSPPPRRVDDARDRRPVSRSPSPQRVPIPSSSNQTNQT
ncbi:hypothetical protein QFC21_000743 [Naganishia friedmannii]|uniref:Uncharacterized protein n=1 Tax=Naganishia friedmannii TaxID=89922 RepID=A0ACC2W745_9TREE|nr:hypothetical protein QFC21_000743 [Naganishia friedmannii]